MNWEQKERMLADFNQRVDRLKDKPSPPSPDDLENINTPLSYLFGQPDIVKSTQFGEQIAALKKIIDDLSEERLKQQGCCCCKKVLDRYITAIYVFDKIVEKIEERQHSNTNHQP